MTVSQGSLLVVDDDAMNRDMLSRRLARHGYTVAVAEGGEQALKMIEGQKFDLVLLDIMMPGVSGLQVLDILRQRYSMADLPVIMATAKDESSDIVEALKRGANDYVTKPLDFPVVLARTESQLALKQAREEIQRLAARLEDQAAQLADWNRTLEQRVAEQVAELERVGRLKGFFSPQLADLILAGGAEDPLKSHRREVTVVFVDLRGFTAFSEITEPEEVMGVLNEYHAGMGKLILAYEATLEHFAGDGIMVFFNDPVPVPNPAERAVRMALEMRDCLGTLTRTWRKQGIELGFGIGIAHGYATMGAIGFEGRWQYGAIGTVANLAARLCDEARDGQILVSQRVYAQVEELVEAEPVGELTLKGLHRPVPTYKLLRL
ncbi:MAG: guanylate cyclase, partial [candidate division NC10 bacterium]|nr:guanylate cyclase [candidate division NC10 bacterium]